MKLQGALLMVVLFGAGMLEAQAIPVVGDQVRVTAAGHRYTGKLMTWTADSVVVREGAHSALLGRGTVTALDREVGRKSDFFRRVGVGALVGGGLGLVLGVMAAANPEDCWCDPGTIIPAGVVVFGGLAAVIVGLASTGSTRSVWEPVPLKPGQVALRLSPVLSPTGLGLRGTISFH